MSSRKEDERNEKIIRGLMKLPPNRKCINCNNLGPQYVCTNFWTFVCIACSGIHREFTHRVKSVSMAKFTKEEVDALQKGGNQRAREIFLKVWDLQVMRFPDSSNPGKIREFIKTVYVDKKYAGGDSSDRPPRDMQSFKNHGEDHRRASSYHSYSQSPPYDQQYEDRRYGKQSAMLTRKPGSERGHYEGKLSSVMYSPGRFRELMYEDRFANDCGSVRSDNSVSSAGDAFRFDGQSPNYEDTGYCSPPFQQARDIIVEDTRPRMLNRNSDTNARGEFDGIPRPQRTASSSSFGSFDSFSLKSANSGSLAETVLEADLSSRTQLVEASKARTVSLPPASVHVTNQDLFNQPFVQPTTTSQSSLDLFADINKLPSSITLPEQKPSGVALAENGGWATFDLPQHAVLAETKTEISTLVPLVDGGSQGNGDLFSSMPNNPQWFPVQTSPAFAPYPPIADQWGIGLTEENKMLDPKSSQEWNAFDGSAENNCRPLISESLDTMNKVPTSIEPCVGLKLSEESINDGSRKLAMHDTVSGLNPQLSTITVPSFAPSTLPQLGGTQHWKSTNPFDLPHDSDLVATNVFLDMSSLQAALPNSELPPFLGGVSQQWFPQNPVDKYIPSVPQGGLPYMAGQAASSQLPNIPPQGPVASFGGNPFA